MQPFYINSVKHVPQVMPRPILFLCPPDIHGIFIGKPAPEMKDFPHSFEIIWTEIGKMEGRDLQAVNGGF
jgi:hypothetical protein